MRRLRFSRREALRALGVGAGMLPLTSATRSYAAEPPFPRRLILVIQTNGLTRDAWKPMGTGTDLTKLALPATTKPLEPYRSDLVMLSGLNLQSFLDSAGGAGAGHSAYSALFTAGPGERAGKDGHDFYPLTPSVDQVIAAEIVKRVPLPLRSLHLAVQVSRSDKREARMRAFWKGRDQPIVPEENPYRLADQLFTGTGPPDPRVERLRIERRSILDFVGKDLERFGSRMGAEDRSRVEAHLESIREIERKLGGAGAPTCASPIAGQTPLDFLANDNYPAVLDVHLDIIVAALRCGVTRVATLQLSDADGDNIVFSWLGIKGTGLNRPIRDWHDFGHQPTAADGSPDKVNADAWLMKQFAGLLARLKATPEGSGTMLDNTAVVWANHMETGGGHGVKDVPIILAGKCGGYFRTGQYIQTPGAPQNGIWVALCNAMGVPVEYFGEQRYGGELAGLRA